MSTELERQLEEARLQVEALEIELAAAKATEPPKPPMVTRKMWDRMSTRERTRHSEAGGKVVDSKEITR